MVLIDLTDADFDWLAGGHIGPGAGASIRWRYEIRNPGNATEPLR